MNTDAEFTIGNDKTMRSSASEALGRIDQYELVRELGGGGFGTVYLARDTVSGVDVAVKGLPPLVRNNREELENIRRNFALVSRLHHPNIAAALVLHPANKVEYFDKSLADNLRVTEGDTLMVMEYAPGVTLSQWRRQFPDSKVPVEKAEEIVRQIAEALDYAHQEKIVHRDIKPSNVMIETRPDGKIVARVLDFGLAAEIRSSMGRISQEVHDTSGTRPYMAPEQWLGGRQGPATDQYSLAVLFYELVFGEVPFASVFDTGDPVVMMNVVGREKAILPKETPKSLRRPLERALAKKPEERFGSCGQFVEALHGRVKKTGNRLWLKIVLWTISVGALAVGGLFAYGQYDRYQRKQRQAEKERKKSIERFEAKNRMNKVIALPDDSGYYPGDVRTVKLPGGVEMEMAYCPPGEYYRGEYDKESQEYIKAQYKVRISKGFWVGRYPVTQAQWTALIKNNNIADVDPRPFNFCVDGAGKEEVSGMDTSKLPAEGMSWNDCDRLIKELNKHCGLKLFIPTDAQWEFAARGGVSSRGYQFSGSDKAFMVAWTFENSGVTNCTHGLGHWREYPATVRENKCRPHAVDERMISNELNIYGMSGNVFEYCSDWDGEYESHGVWRCLACGNVSDVHPTYGDDHFTKRCPSCKTDDAWKIVYEVQDPTGPENGNTKVVRGGCYMLESRVALTHIRGSWCDPGSANGLGTTGLRLCCETIKDIDFAASVEKNDAEGLSGSALKYYQQAKTNGDAESCFQMGRCYINGDGVASNAVEAAKWYRKAVEQGHAGALYNLSCLYRTGNGVEREQAKFIDLCRKSAVRGCAAAQNDLGVAYYLGNGVASNCFEAVKWFRMAAEQGYAKAQYNMGCCYARGYGVQSNLVEAAKWVRKAAERNYPKAQGLLGRMYWVGEGVEKCDAEAVKWCRKGAEQGDPMSQNNLGYCYLEGIGVEKNFGEAEKWFRKAASQGNKKATENLEELANRKANSAEAERTRQKTDAGNTMASKGHSDKSVPGATRAKAIYTPYVGPTREYVVKSGDTLGGIAYGNGINIRQLKELNNLTSDAMHVGMKLRIPSR